MPPRSLIASLLGPVNSTLEKSKLLVEDFPSLDAVGAISEILSLTRATINEVGAPTSTSFPIKAQRSPKISVEPDAPILRKSTGNSLKIEQLWEGTVARVHQDSIEAVLIDKSRSNSPAEQVEFDLSEVRPDDLPLVAPGSVFYWMIGKELTPGGSLSSVSKIDFLRLPEWTFSAIHASCGEAESNRGWFLKDSEDRSSIENAEYPTAQRRV